MLFKILVCTISTVFVLFHLGLVMGLILERFRGLAAMRKATVETSGIRRPLVSVIIPARNEASRIEILLQSLRNQDYPALEIIFINDRSTDLTSDLLSSFKASMPPGRVRVLDLESNPGPNFKQYALSQGLEVATGEYYLFTDADCEVSPAWVRSMAGRLSDSTTGLVIAPVYKRMEGKRFFDQYQAFDHIIRYVYLAGATGLGIAAGGFGNNLIFKKSALDAIGGYAAVPYSVTEDAALISLIRTSTSYKIRAALDTDCSVLTQGESSWSQLVSQCLRWNNGGLFAPDIATRLGFGSLMIFISLGIVALPLLLFIPVLWPLSVAVYISITVGSLAAFSFARKNMPAPYIRYVPLVIFTPIFFAVLTVLGYAGVRVRWKDATLQKK
ncbi:hydroxychlorobactene glucosyltransferase CruC [Treponema sp.]